MRSLISAIGIGGSAHGRTGSVSADSPAMILSSTGFGDGQSIRPERSGQRHATACPSKRCAGSCGHRHRSWTPPASGRRAGVAVAVREVECSVAHRPGLAVGHDFVQARHDLRDRLPGEAKPPAGCRGDLDIFASGSDPNTSERRPSASGPSGDRRSCSRENHSRLRRSRAALGFDAGALAAGPALAASPLALR